MDENTKGIVKAVIITVIATIITGWIGWVSLGSVELKTDMAVVKAAQVDTLNHIKAMWRDQKDSTANRKSDVVDAIKSVERGN